MTPTVFDQDAPEPEESREPTQSLLPFVTRRAFRRALEHQRRVNAALEDQVEDLQERVSLLEMLIS